jgi:hypothetical protein
LRRIVGHSLVGIDGFLEPVSWNYWMPTRSVPFTRERSKVRSLQRPPFNFLIYIED